MGYCISVEMGGVVIPKDKVADCLKAINDLHRPEMVSKHGGGGAYYVGGELNGQVEKYYSWVDSPPETGFPSLIAAFEAWRYHAIERDGNIEVDYFTGEKMGDDEFFWRNLAPFIVSGAEIYFRGEDDCHWKYVFKAPGTMREVLGKLVWEE